MKNTMNNTSLNSDMSNALQFGSNALAADILNGGSVTRGKMGSVYAEEAELNRRMMKARMENPEYYSYSDEIEQDNSNRYRTGIDVNGCYMTVDDYIRFCYDKQTSVKNSTRSGSEKKNASASARPAHAYSYVKLSENRNALSSREAVYMDEKETEMHVSTYRTKKSGLLQHLGQKYIGNEKVVSAGIDQRHMSGTVATVALILFFSVLFALPVLLKIMIFSERNTVESLNSEKESTEAQIVQLKEKIDIKNSEADIESLALDLYGMTKIDESSYSVISLNPEELIEKAEKTEKKTVALPALLNALGIRIQNAD